MRLERHDNGVISFSANFKERDEVGVPNRRVGFDNLKFYGKII